MVLIVPRIIPPKTEHINSATIRVHVGLDITHRWAARFVRHKLDARCVGYRACAPAANARDLFGDAPL